MIQQSIAKYSKWYIQSIEMVQQSIANGIANGIAKGIAKYSKLLQSIAKNRKVQESIAKSGNDRK